MDLSELEFAGTIWELINRGRDAPLIAYIRSDKVLRPQDRGYLADYLEGKLKRKRGRPIGGLESQKIRFLAGQVRAFKAPTARARGALPDSQQNDRSCVGFLFRIRQASDRSRKIRKLPPPIATKVPQKIRQFVLVIGLYRLVYKDRRRLNRFRCVYADA